ncbi:hypothetical protein M6D93_09115 [Jatrophihabitans telluris]|uniref:Polynucleotide kinase PNKP phosphatase domain-containing protein n=1 Tax=Jatrophihabitans telluris TaxID=2038343 RepID=A0ABY4R2T8_9ACTN|nr:hypothetical protein [Jatrophihabitans telluris]UQX90140.1 hypothetical protein M6D93_09115 [Jatrophihabitans telluris]
MTLAVFDIDGVVADVRHRLHYLEGRYQDWESFFEGAHADPVLEQGAALVKRYRDDGHDIAWLTGRPSWLRSVTQNWLVAAGLPTDELLMRASGDYRPARFLKVQVLRSLAEREILLFVDDDPDVVATAAAAGFTTLHATWVPHSKTLRRAQEVNGRT